jgi:hypothetical protein
MYQGEQKQGTCIGAHYDQQAMLPGDYETLTASVARTEKYEAC